jgi:hypothetical protein
MRLKKEMADKIARNARAAANRSARTGGHETHIYGLGNGATAVIEVQIFRNGEETFRYLKGVRK